MSESVEQSERDRIVEIWREIAILCDKLNGVAEKGGDDDES